MLRGFGSSTLILLCVCGPHGTACRVRLALMGTQSNLPRTAAEEHGETLTRHAICHPDITQTYFEGYVGQMRKRSNEHVLDPVNHVSYPCFTDRYPLIETQLRLQ
ncbi:hypothetical protein K503DRAFT_223026 [Rhizopogon vinicolor AM-OR11-026]|uniref:Secreted protein n=1 Tax=Rhizopogon vinicolor AM-OR11-026 TaxID=1314800 RepID=A0A1B7NEB3_9AGAM|nr:hypothetical protein K503DRAFT_223026 [Rhizopogon vinicolor AM-OR11-026]